MDLWFSTGFSLPIYFRKVEAIGVDGVTYKGLVWSQTGQAWISPRGYKFPLEVSYWRYL